eukprot:8855887-Prorocentrum_lima.AAC.1
MLATCHQDHVGWNYDNEPIETNAILDDLLEYTKWRSSGRGKLWTEKQEVVFQILHRPRR